MRFVLIQTLSLCVEIGIIPFHYYDSTTYLRTKLTVHSLSSLQRLSLTAEFLTTILEHPKITTHNHIFHPLPSVYIDKNLEQQLNCTFEFQALTSILAATPWQHPPPHTHTINLSLDTPKIQPYHQSSEASSENSFTHFSSQPYASSTALQLITEPVSHI